MLSVLHPVVDILTRATVERQSWICLTTVGQTGSRLRVADVVADGPGCAIVAPATQSIVDDEPGEHARGRVQRAAALEAVLQSVDLPGRLGQYQLRHRR